MVGGCGSTIPTKISLRGHRIIIEDKQTTTVVIDENTGKEIKSKKKEIVYTALTVRNIFKNIRN